MDEKFETVWQALVEHGSSRKNEEAVRRFWNTLSPRQKETAVNNIPRKVRAGDFVQYDPIRAIRENIRAYLQPEPENYNGRCLKRGVQYVVAKYRGAYGTYSLEDAREFGMERKDGTIFN